MKEHFRIASNGLELAVESFGAGPPLIFAHGLTGNRHFTRLQLAPLADQYRIVIYDQRGHCDSSPITDPTLYDPVQMAEDMTAVLDALGIEKAIVGGESMGAATTLLFALRHPERVEKLLLTAPAFGDEPNPATADIQQMGETIAQLGLERFLQQAAIRQRDELKWSPVVIERVGQMQGSHNTNSLALACQTVIKWQILHDLTALSTLNCPVCILAWPGDVLHPLSLAQRYAATLPNAVLEMLPPLPGLFENPQMVGEIYGRFLQSSFPPHPAESIVQLHPNGYVEIVLVGIVEGAQLQKLLNKMNGLFQEYGPCNVLVDGRYGRLGRDPGTLLTLAKWKPDSHLQQMIILTDSNLYSKTTIVGTGQGIVPSMTTLSLGAKPIYTSDEAQARQMATEPEMDWLSRKGQLIE